MHWHISVATVTGMGRVTPHPSARAKEDLLRAIALQGENNKTEWARGSVRLMSSGTPFPRFGVCCIFVFSDTTVTTDKNCSYLQNPGFPSAYNETDTITYTINKCSNGMLFLPNNCDFHLVFQNQFLDMILWRCHSRVWNYTNSRRYRHSILFTFSPVFYATKQKYFLYLKQTHVTLHDCQDLQWLRRKCEYALI